MRASAKTAALILPVLFVMLEVGVGSQSRRGDDERPDAPALAASVPPVDVRTSISRTAVWVGDRVVYTVTLRCAPNVDVLADDLLKERLKVDGGEILTAEPERAESEGYTTTRMRYTLVTYRVDATAITVGPLPVRYYARGRGQRPGDTAPAGEVTIPPLTVAVRSTVPEAAQAIELRPAGGVRPASPYLRLAAPVGLGLLAAAVVPTVILGLGLAGRARNLSAAYRGRRHRRKQRGSFDEIKSLQPSLDSERVEAYGRLDAFVRDRLSLTMGSAAHSLTPSAMNRALQARGDRVPHDEIEKLLEACERARYAPDPPSAAAWADTVRDAEGVVRDLPR